MKVGIIIAMDIEYEMMARILGNRSEGRIGNNDIVLWHSGIGKVNAAVGTINLMSRHHPDCVLSTGLAGGIDSQMRVRDVIVGSRMVYHDVWCGEGNDYGQVQGLPTYYVSHEVLAQTARRVGEEFDGSHHVVEGLICTGDKFITEGAQLAAIKSQFPQGLACDMESAAIAQTCYLLQVPFASIRVISDTPGNTDDHQQQWSDFLSTMGRHSFDFMNRYLSLLPERLG